MQFIDTIMKQCNVTLQTINIKFDILMIFARLTFHLENNVNDLLVQNNYLNQIEFNKNI